MTMQDPIADMLTNIRNAQMVGHQDVTMPGSAMKQEIARVLQEEGYIESFEALEVAGHPKLKIVLRYHEQKPVIEEIHRTSRPGLRIYKGARDLPVIRGGYGIAILSTSQGVISSRTAKAKGLGGEVLCTVF